MSEVLNQGVLLAAVFTLVSGCLGYLIASLRARPLVAHNQQLIKQQQQQEIQLNGFSERAETAQLERQQLAVDFGKLQTLSEATAEQLQQSHQQLSSRSAELATATANVQQLKQSEAMLQTKVEAESRRFDDLQQRFNEVEQGFQKQTQDYQQLIKTHAELSTELDTKQQHFDQQVKLLQESKSSLKQEFENLANEILDKKGNAFKKLNVESLHSVLTPIHNELKGFKAKVEDIHGKETEQRVQLRTELENLQKLNREITDQADRLTTALQGEKKVQGNWGELMLENVLESSGLRLGQDYKREVSFNAEEGRLRPDAVIYLPQNKHLVIDAKTSLNAYTRYVNNVDDELRTQALKEHCLAVRERLSELASKDYCKLPGINSPEVVIMFIPVESAYVEALKADEQLFQYALQNNILIATPTTLLTSLNIVSQLWRFEEQSKHTAELASRAEKFYNKLATFLSSMQGVGGQLDKAKVSYEKAMGQLVSGPANLIKQASEFKQLGVSVQKELPADLIDKAQLELGTDQLSNNSETSENNSID